MNLRNPVIDEDGLVHIDRARFNAPASRAVSENPDRRRRCQ